ncbi:hypothetical protein [Ignavibacterium sp.]|uniref:hypothetical protein n=1 Tax=Ignavibacterium sp. TaxID=2651167 RepID=UPI00307EE168
MNFPIVRYKVSDEWVPETDIDGVDTREVVLSKAEGIDYYNGFIEPSIGYRANELPTNVIQHIEYGYKLLSVKRFRHSTQGNNTVFVLSKYNNVNLDYDVAVLINDTVLDYGKSRFNITIYEEPHNINYNLVENELKINLNSRCLVDGTYLSREIILNLDLYYLDSELRYNETYGVNPGWQLRIRWLGWQYKANGNYSAFVDYMMGNPKEYYEDFNDDNFITNLHTSNLPAPYIPANRVMLRTNGIMGSENGNTQPYQFHYVAFKIDKLRNVGKIKFGLFVGGANYLPGEMKIVIEDYSEPNYNKRFRELYKISIPEYTLRNHSFLEQLEEIEVNVNKIDFSANAFALIFQMIVPPKEDAPNTINTKIGVDWLSIHGMDSLLLGVYKNNQRALLSNGFGDGLFIPIYNGFPPYYGNRKALLNLYIFYLDHAITKYEIYVKDESFGSYILEASLIPDNNWEIVGNTIRRDITPIDHEEEGYTTLQETYNLTENDKVDNMFNIYSEVIYKSRVYFVNGGHKVYMSHITGNLATQRDSFPYNEEQGFGFFIVDYSKSNKLLAISPINDLMIFTNEGIYIFNVQPSGGSVLKTLRMYSSNGSISSLGSITVSLGGSSYGEKLFWIDRYGIYSYQGGMQQPDNHVMGKLQRYWEKLSDDLKTDAIGFYFPLRMEYWIVLPEYAILRYEMKFDKFRTYPFSHRILGFIGYNDANPMLLVEGVDYPGIVEFGYNRVNGVIETHYTTTEDLPEIAYKILQELYLEFGTSESNKIVRMELYVDDQYVDNYLFNSSLRYDKWLSPIGLRFNRLKLVLHIPGANVRIKEFGFTYVKDVQEPLGSVPSTSSSGYGYNYGQNYGVGL